MRKSISRAVLILMISLFVISGSVLAAGGNGDGSGGGNGEPLALENSNIKDGESGVAIDKQIKLTFSKNITHDSVRLNNQKAFSIVDQDGKEVAINVILADSSNENEKNNVIVKAANGFEEGGRYTLTIDSSLESKSGVAFAKSQNITFSTIQKAISTQTETNNVESNNTESKSSSVNSSDNKVTNPKTGDDINGNIIVSIAIIAMLCISKGYSLHKKSMN